MILALQTASATTHIWLIEPGQHEQKPALIWESGRELADGLLPQITAVVASHHKQLADLKGIVVFGGPGSFTSLRIGHAVANALADSLEIPVVGSIGDDWLGQGLTAVMDAPCGRPVLPHYGAEANITKRKA